MAVRVVVKTVVTMLSAGLRDSMLSLTFEVPHERGSYADGHDALEW